MQPWADHVDVGRQQRDCGDATLAEGGARAREIGVEARGWQCDRLSPADLRRRGMVERLRLDLERLDVSCLWQRRGGRCRGGTHGHAAAVEPGRLDGGGRGAVLVALEAELRDIADRERIQEVALDAP